MEAVQAPAVRVVQNWFAEFRDREQDGDGVLDFCADCNGNGQSDIIDIMQSLAPDCDGNFIPDECDPDCDNNGAPDACDLMFTIESPVLAPIGDAGADAQGLAEGGRVARGRKR